MNKIFKTLLQIAENVPLIQSSRHAACVTYKGKIVSIGISQLKSHPLQLKFQPNKARIFLHAEIDAIVKAINSHGSDFLKDCELHVLRLTKGNKLGMSKPCPGCQKAIEAFGIQNIHYTTGE